MASCCCGCGRTVSARCRTGYARGCLHRGNVAHFSRIGKIVHQRRPELRQEMLRLARLGWQKRTAERVKGMTKQQAYTAGYKAAYQRAYRYWKYRAEKRTA
jgi:hypothetical protein